MSVTIPYVFVGGAGNKARAAEVNANFAALQSKFTEGAGGISDGDISTTAGIKGSKLSSVAGNRVAAAQLEDDAVDFRVLKDDATSGSPNAAVNTAQHIKDGIITNAKLVASTIARDRLKLASVLVAVGVIGPLTVTNIDTTLLSTNAFPVMWHMEGAVDPANLTLPTELALNTATGRWLLHFSNDSSTFSSGAFNMRIYYLQLT